MRRVAFLAETWPETAAAFRQLLKDNDDLTVSDASPMTAYFPDGVEIRAVAFSGLSTHSIKSWWFDQIVLVNPSSLWWQAEEILSTITWHLSCSFIPPEWRILTYDFVSGVGQQVSGPEKGAADLCPSIKR